MKTPLIITLYFLFTFLLVPLVVVNAANQCFSPRTKPAKWTPPEKKTVHAILGEARGEGYSAMYAVACAIHNRGTLDGVQGLKADVSDASPEIVQQAYKAYFLSVTGPDVTGGATEWRSWDDLVSMDGVRQRAWLRQFEPTCWIGGHLFLKKKS